MSTRVRRSTFAPWSLSPSDELIAIADDSPFELIACGSYRRQTTTCGDVDVVLTTAKAHDNDARGDVLDGAVAHLVASLRRAQLVLAELTQAVGHGRDVMLICCAEPRGAARRVDVRVAPRRELATTTLICTGSGEFNNALALRARAVGMKLSRHGLLRLFDDNGGRISGARDIGCRRSKI